jgi:RNA polymerase sigma-70 factor (ECF subfamily)
MVNEAQFARFMISSSPSTPPKQSNAPELCNTPELWLEQHGNLLYKFALLRVRDSFVAEDLVQETFVKAFAKFDSFRGDASVRTWLFSILRNEISNYYRAKKREKKNEGEPESAIPMDQLLCPQISKQQFSSSVEKEEFWDVVQICFQKMPEHLLATFLCRLTNPVEKIDDLCNSLGISASNFSVRIFRARLLLRECLERFWMVDGK